MTSGLDVVKVGACLLLAAFTRRQTIESDGSEEGDTKAKIVITNSGQL